MKKEQKSVKDKHYHISEDISGQQSIVGDIVVIATIFQLSATVAESLIIKQDLVLLIALHKCDPYYYH